MIRQNRPIIPQSIRQARASECSGHRLTDEGGKETIFWKCRRCLRFNIRVKKLGACFQ
jgi:hypothetical protein